jgi:hypothetical protein
MGLQNKNQGTYKMAYLDENQIGEVTEVTGAAIVIRTDGSEEQITLGTEIFEGDIVETTDAGAVNIGFIDDSSFAVSSDARIAIDEFVFDPASEAGAQDFSVLRGVFMYTSGLIGRENPDSVEIDTPVGSIGIRGTIIGGNINPDGESQVTVIEGAIVVRNNGGEQLLTTQYDTVRLNSMDMAPSSVETLSVDRVANDYGAIKDVSSDLFSSFNDQMSEQGASEGLDKTSVSEDVKAEAEDKTDIEVLDNASDDSISVELKSMDGRADTIKPKPELDRNRSSDENKDNADLKEPIDTRRFGSFNNRAIEFKTGGNVDENATTGTVVGQVGPTNAFDFNAIYSLVGPTSSLFSIDPATGIVTLDGTAKDFETSPQQFYNLGVQVTNADDGESRTFGLRLGLNDALENGDIKLALQDVYDIPNETGVIYSYTSGARIGRIRLDVTDADEYDASDFTIDGDYLTPIPSPEPLSDVFEVIEVNQSFILKLQDGYSIENTNDIHFGGSSIGTLLIPGGEATIGLTVDGISQDINFVIEDAVNISDTVSQGTDFILSTSGIAIGTNDDDNFVVQDANFKLIRAQKGYDTLRFDENLGGNVDILDLTSNVSNIVGNSADIKGIEEIIISDNSSELNNILKMNVADLLNLLRTSDAQIDGKNIFKVTAADIANAGDKSNVEFYTGVGQERLDQVDVDGQAGADFVASGTIEDNGHTYNVFVHDLGNVLLDQNLGNATTG